MARRLTTNPDNDHSPATPPAHLECHALRISDLNTMALRCPWGYLKAIVNAIQVPSIAELRQRVGKFASIYVQFLEYLIVPDNQQRGVFRRAFRRNETEDGSQGSRLTRVYFPRLRLRITEAIKGDTATLIKCVITAERKASIAALVYETLVDDVCTLRNRIVAGCETIRNFPGIHQRILVSIQRRADSCANRVLFPAGSLPDFSHMGIVPDDAAGRRIFSGVSRLPRLCIPALLHTLLTSTSSALNNPLIRAVNRFLGKCRTKMLKVWCNPAVAGNATITCAMRMAEETGEDVIGACVEMRLVAGESVRA
ncbi:hypothetical protein PR048_011872 [Dryococelus australis]|uniref:Uncharacterized protein n=1 Tax=Dryococelus australis TaxID=614101 RepID=A0ABQ9HMR7_9NEOP|nr:hypothetical protein PR048_011872 [Dryococelus australis]